MVYKKRFLARADSQVAKRRRTISRPMPISPEVKYYAKDLSFSAPDTTGLNLLNGIIRGSNRDERIGDHIRVSKIEVSIALNSAVPDGTVPFATPMTKHWLYSRNGNSSVQWTPTSMVQEPDPKDFRIWVRKAPAESMNLTSFNGGATPLLMLRKTFSKPMKVTFDDSTMVEEQSNGIYLSSVGTEAQLLAQTINPQIIAGKYTVRVWYYDY